MHACVGSGAHPEAEGVNLPQHHLHLPLHPRVLVEHVGTLRIHVLPHLFAVVPKQVRHRRMTVKIPGMRAAVSRQREDGIGICNKSAHPVLHDLRVAVGAFQ